jgi:protein involved in polysaccharide export with SLBB domain
MQMRSLYSSFLMISLIGACVSGCESVSGLFGHDHRESASADVIPTWWDGPRVRPGVALIFQVGTPAAAPTTISTLVDQNGDVTGLPLLQEPVACDGLTLEALKQKLMKAYSVYYRQPQITVTFAPYDGKGVSPWGTVTVLGEVISPGPVNIPSTMELTVTKALQMAGGVKPFADRSGIKVSRCDKDGQVRSTIVDLKEIGKGGRVDKDMALRAGDVVWVPETWY